MTENESSPMLTHEDPMLASPSKIQDQPTILKNTDQPEDVDLISVEEFSDQSVDFKVGLDAAGEKDAYERSNSLSRVYTCTDRSITFDITFKPILDCVLSSRIMLVCSNLLHHPLARCSHHRKGDNTTFNEHVVRHRDALAEYVGTANGKHYSERLAILVPLDDTGHKSISLDFVCLNSCHKIRKLKLALVFTLEVKESGKILARKVFNIQISKNFKRDMEVAEKALPAKRPSAELLETDEPPAKRPLLSPLTVQPSSSKDLPNRAEERPVELNINLNLPRGAAQEFLNFSRQFFEAKLYRSKEQEEHEMRPCLDEIMKKLDSLEDSKPDGKKD